MVILPPCVHYAGNEKFIRKAFALQDTGSVPFDVCCDLEDGAALGSEGERLKLFIDLLKEYRGRGKRVGVRIHPVDGEHWWTELKALLERVPDEIAFLTLPKVRGTRDVEVVLREMAMLRAKLKLNKLPPLHVLIETQSALDEIRSIARLPGLQALEFGMMDFIADHGGAIPEECLRSPAQFEHQLLIRAKTEIVAASLANGLVPSHNMCPSFDNPEAVRADAMTAHRFFGFLRMWSIHPSQIEPINDAFAPDLSQVEKARKILAAAEKANWGPIRFEGRLEDRASYRVYRSLVERAQLYGA